MIRLNRLNKYFYKNKKNEIHVLNDISIDLPKKGLVVLLGPSGSGKTTLLNVIGGLDKTNQGTIVFDQEELKTYKSSVWDDIRNQKVGYIFQNYNLLNGLSVYDNVAFVLKLLGVVDKEKINENVTYILQSVGMYKFRKKKATQLSGGQQQRVAIARALVKNPEIVIADEPTGNLDSKNTFDVMKIIKDISKTKLVVLVTHEKNIAQIYADRIIELKDGQIVNDYENVSALDYEHIDENTIYLKDMDQTYSHTDEEFDVNMYQDQKEQTDPVKIRLIVKNKTLYVDIDSSYQKVKLLDNTSNLIIRDEHFKKLEQSDYEETSFDQNLLHIDKKDYGKSKLLISFNQIFKIAIEKIFLATRKGKLLLFSLFVTGILLALITSQVAYYLIPSADDMKYGEHYVVLFQDYTYLYSQQDSTTDNTGFPTYAELSALLSPTDYVNTAGTISFSIYDPITLDTFSGISVSGYLDLIDHSSDYSLIYGTLPEGDNQIVITKGAAEDLLLPSYSGTSGQTYGIWNIEDLLYEKLLYNDVEYTISGILDSDQQIIYASRNTVNILSSTKYFYHYGTGYYDYLAISTLSNQLVTSDDLLYGTYTSTDDLLITNTLYQYLITNDVISATDAFPITSDFIDYPISGVIDDDTSNVLYASNDLIEEFRYTSSFVESMNYYGKVYIYSKDVSSLAKTLNENTDLLAYSEPNYFTIQGMEIFTDALALIIVVIIVAMSFFGFYFLMHSSMVSRIYEIAVYRSLGMKKKELIISYIFETIILSSATSIIGFIATSLIIINANQNSTYGTMLRVTPLSVLIGLVVVYLLNIIGGITPILTLLRKTPAEITAKYDI